MGRGTMLMIFWVNNLLIMCLAINDAISITSDNSLYTYFLEYYPP